MKYKDKVIVSNCTSTWCHKSSSCENFTFTDWIKSIWAQAGRGSIREKQERDALQSRKEAILAQALLSETCDRKTYLAIVFIGQLLFFFYQKERCYGSEILNVCMSNQKKMIYGKKSFTRPPLHIVLCYNSRWNGPIFSFWATERLFISKWGRISPESDWCWFKLVLGSSSLLLSGSTDISLAGRVN